MKLPRPLQAKANLDQSLQSLRASSRNAPSRRQPTRPALHSAARLAMLCAEPGLSQTRLRADCRNRQQQMRRQEIARCRLGIEL